MAIPGMLGAAHKPGAMPLRPLGLGDLYDAAFKTIRFNPGATVGPAVLVATVAMSIPVIVTAILGYAVGLGLDPATDPTVGDPSSAVFTTTAVMVAALGPFAASALGGLLSALGVLLVTGMIAHVTRAAAVGRRLTLGQAWAATRGKRWRLLGLALLLFVLTLGLIASWIGSFFLLDVLGVPGVLLGLYGILSFFGFLVVLAWFWIRVYYLPVPALMLEDVGVFRAIGRGYRLTSRHFWRTFGIALLTWIVTQVAQSVIGIPLGIAAGFVGADLSPTDAMMALVVAQSVSSIAATAFTAPFASAVSSLQYLDLRMRKESLDVRLMAEAGLTGV
ncbi:MAG: hypothetical protein R2734_13405 [Nocardioides sp.]